MELCGANGVPDLFSTYALESEDHRRMPRCGTPQKMGPLFDTTPEGFVGNRDFKMPSKAVVVVQVIAAVSCAQTGIRSAWAHDSALRHVLLKAA
jgi:hypothetical protein